MPVSNLELRAIQKRTLHELLVVKKDIEAKSVTSQPLDMYISVKTSEMDAEDIAYVEKIVNNP